MIWVIEPHVDDAYLSLHRHLTTVWNNQLITIVSVFCDKRRSKEAHAYAAVVGASSMVLLYPESGSMEAEGVHLPPFKEWQLPIKPGDIIVSPLGLQHPEHHIVAQRVATWRAKQQRLLGCRYTFWQYLDAPYYAKQKLEEEVNARMFGRTAVSFCNAPKSKFKHVGIFKSQAKFYHFNPPDKLPRFELVVR